MADSQEFAPGTIVWNDLTIPDADAISRFYEKVVGWERSLHPGCDDFDMTPPGGSEPAAGVCYRAGTNAGMPPQWIVYVAVEDVRKSIEVTEAEGGKVVDGPRYVGNHLFCVIQDPTGAYLGLISGRPVPRENDGKGTDEKK